MEKAESLCVRIYLSVEFPSGEAIEEDLVSSLVVAVVVEQLRYLLHVHRVVERSCVTNLTLVGRHLHQYTHMQHSFKYVISIPSFEKKQQWFQSYSLHSMKLLGRKFFCVIFCWKIQCQTHNIAQIIHEIHFKL